MRRTIAFCWLGSALIVGSQSAQEPGRQQVVPAPVFNTVIRFRRAWLADSTRFDACSVSRWIGRGSDGTPPVMNPERVLLGQGGAECVPGRLSPAAQAAQHVVVVHSVVPSDSVTRVQVSVRHGDYRHFETFSLIPHRMRGTWGVREVRVWGAIVVSPPHRPQP